MNRRKTFVEARGCCYFQWPPMALCDMSRIGEKRIVSSSDEATKVMDNECTGSSPPELSCTNMTISNVSPCEMLTLRADTDLPTLLAIISPRKGTSVGGTCLPLNQNSGVSLARSMGPPQSAYSLSQEAHAAWELKDKSGQAETTGRQFGCFVHHPFASPGSFPICWWHATTLHVCIR